jgi:aromatic ring-opening dioxygenase catalytic subunit (LigB family)
MDPVSQAPYAALAQELTDMPRAIGGTPRAVLMISAHWEEEAFTLTASARPPMIYDYGGFPDYTYQIRYDARGDAALAELTRELIADAGLPAALDTERGFDHGAFTPLNVMYPKADVPVVQLSLKAGLDPAAHLALGRAVAPLRDRGVLIIGSGLTYHNLRQFFTPRAWGPSREFDDWLNQTVLGSPPETRVQRLLAWESAPSARAAHPREEHLLPLMVAVGAAGADTATMPYHENQFLGGITVSNYRFG